MIDSDKFSKRLEQIMEQHDLNASSFAEKVGVGRSSISHILSGRNKPSLDFVLSVLKNFDDVELYWLLNGKGSYPKSKKQDVAESHIPTEVTKPAPSNLIEHQEKSESINSSNEELDPETTTGLSNVKNKKGKNITKVIWFYDDGTFDDFQPNP